jgi:hypothetical protein
MSADDDGLSTRDEMVNAETARRVSDLRKWFLGALCHYEQRDTDSIRAATAHLLKEWGEDWDQWARTAHALWLSIEHDLSIAIMRDRGPQAAMDFLGPAKPEWNIYEVPLVLGFLLIDIAASLLKSPAGWKHMQAALLLCDATSAQHFWAHHRGLTKCRNPDPRMVQFDAVEEASLIRHERSKLARRNSDKRFESLRKARTWLIEEWGRNQAAYGGNKSEFARHYVRLLLAQRGVKVTEKTVREVWLNDTPDSSKRAGMPASGD